MLLALVTLTASTCFAEIKTYPKAYLIEKTSGIISYDEEKGSSIEGTFIFSTRENGSDPFIVTVKSTKLVPYLESILSEQNNRMDQAFKEIDALTHKDSPIPDSIRKRTLRYPVNITVDTKATGNEERDQNILIKMTTPAPVINSITAP